MQRKKRILVSTEFSKLNTGYSCIAQNLLSAWHATGKYELFEHARYCRDGDPYHQQLKQQIPWTVYGNLPNTPEEENIYNSNPTAEFGSWKLEQILLECQPDIVCFPPKTPVMTNNGYKEIHEIKVGDSVLTHKNRFKKVIQNIRREYQGNLIGIYTNGCSEPIKLTPEHPVLIYKNRKQTNQKKSILDIYKDENAIFIPAKDVKSGDFVVLPTFDSQTSITLDIRNYLVNFITEGSFVKENTHPNNNCLINIYIDVNNDLARLVGYIIGDGCIQEQGVTISFQGNEISFAEDAVEIYKKIFGSYIEPTIRYCKDKYMIDVEFNSTLVAEFFGKWIGLRTRTKFVPQEIIFGDDSVRANLLCGLVRSDGCYQKNTISFSTVSRMLAYTYRALCASIGIAALIHVDNTKPSKTYVVNVHGRDAINLHQYVNKKENITNCPESVLRDSSHVKLLDKGHFISKIKRVRSDINYSGQVYNLEVEEDQSYVTQWCVHNCSWDDAWMSMFIDQSPFRKFFKWVQMPTVDACFLANTPVITDSIVKNIEDIVIGDNVISHDGTINKTNRIYKKEYIGDLINIQSNGPTLPITLTPEHPVFVVKNNGQKWTHTSRLHRSVNHSAKDAKFIPACDVEVGDYLVIPNTNTFENLTSIKVENYLRDIDYKECSHGLYTAKNYTQSHNILNNIELTKDFVGFLGLYVAEGSLVEKTENGMLISMCKSKEQEYLDFADCEMLGFNSRILGNFLKNICGCGAHNKKIPDFIFKSNPHIAIAFLEKLFVGDGCDTNTPHQLREISYSTASRTLAFQITRLLLQLGVLSSLSEYNNNYKISVLNYHGKKLAELFDWDNDNYEFSDFDNTKSWIDDETGHALVRVSKIDKRTLSEPTPVYNLGVDAKESYCVGFSVHNCSQNPEWISLYQNTDAVLTYTKFGYDVLKEEGGGTIPLCGVATPAVDTNVYKMFPDKRSHKQAYGLDPDSIIIGMVARNQRRKLFPELAQGFADFVSQMGFENTDKVFLYWHTSHPDVGWNLPEYIRNNGLSHKVLLTYFCHNCKFWFPAFYRDSRTVCPRCRQGSAVLSNSQIGVDDTALASVYNFMDLYVQFVTCVAKGTPILTKNGEKSIEDIKIGDYVFTHNKRYRKVIDTFKNLSKDPIKEIKLCSILEKLTVTDNHQIFAYTRNEINGNPKRSVRENIGTYFRVGKELPNFSKYPVKELQKGDILLYPIDDSVEDIESIDLKLYYKPYKYTDTTISTRDKDYDRFIKIDKDFCRFVGLYVANGGLNTSRGVKITSNKLSLESIELSKNIFSKLSNMKERLYEDRNAVDIYINSIIHNSFFGKEFSKLENKHLPEWTLKLPHEKQKEIVLGMFMGDGCYYEGNDNRPNRNICSYTTISYRLYKQLVILLRRLRIDFNVRIVKKSGNRHPQYCFEVYGDVKHGILDSTRHSTMNFYYNGYHCVQIKSIKDSKYLGDVYNLEVEEDNSFTTNSFVIKNCEGLGIPALEAAACGCPIAGTYYSGVEDLIDNLQGKAIQPRTMWIEAETSRSISMPSITELTEYIKEFTALPASVRASMGYRTASLAKRYYGGWERVAQTWMDVFDSIELPQQNPWASPPELVNTQLGMPSQCNQMADDQFVSWLLTQVLRRPDWVNAYPGLRMLRDLTWGRSITNNLGFFASELSMFGMKPQYQPLDRNTLFQHVIAQRSRYNNAEQMRMYMVQNGGLKSS